MKVVLLVLTLLQMWELCRTQPRSLGLWEGSTCGEHDEQCLGKRQLVGESLEMLPCICEAEPDLRDLGPLYFPRYLRYVRCNTSSCWIPPYHCVQRLYTVHVLKRRGVDQTAEDKILPSDLRQDWYFEKFTITVGCECALRN